MDRPPTREEAHAPDYKNTTFERPCLACGYDLRGLGEEARCPECGLLNVSEGFRSQVQEEFDSGRRSFSSPLTPWKPRLPGWFWALDRDADLSVCAKRACFNVVGFYVVVVLLLLASSSVAIRQTNTVSWTDPESNAPKSFSCDVHHRFLLIGQGSLNEYFEIPNRLQQFGIRPSWNFGASFVFSGPAEMSPRYLCAVLIIAAFLLVSLLLPGLLGIATQIRKGLPDYASPRRSVWSALLLETQLLWHFAIAFLLFAGVEVALRHTAYLNFRGGLFQREILLILAASISLQLYAAALWIGPVRSDFTNQLIRSRRHAARIVVMYALVFPVILLIATVLLISFAVNPMYDL